MRIAEAGVQEQPEALGTAGIAPGPACRAVPGPLRYSGLHTLHQGAA